MRWYRAAGLLRAQGSRLMPDKEFEGYESDNPWADLQRIVNQEGHRQLKKPRPEPEPVDDDDDQYTGLYLVLPLDDEGGV